MSDHGLILQRQSVGHWRFSMTVSGMGRVVGQMQVDVPSDAKRESEEALARERVKQFGIMIAKAEIAG